MARLLVAGLLVTVATPLLAQPAPAPPMTMGMAKTMTRTEVQTRVQTQFAKRDVNRDGFLTTEELRSQHGQRHGMMRHHGQMGQQAMRDPNIAFDRLDANRDGAISREEFARGRVVRIEKRVVVNHSDQPGATAMEHGHMGGMPGTRHDGGGMMFGAMFKMADANKDGRVSLAEATAGALKHFDMMDVNRDGRITPDERATGRAQMKAMRGAG